MSDVDPPTLKICPQCGREYDTAARFCPEDGAALRARAGDPLIGSMLAGRYQVIRRIGEGGMGRVYLGEHVKMQRQCAIKVMNPALVNDADSSARFAREASSAARIIHPNVAAVFDYGESDGLVYLVMEYVDGEPLSHILAHEAPLELDRAIDIARQIADGLGAAHELGIIHRDLKPDNILISRTRTGKETAKVVDFGIAKPAQEIPGKALTQTGHVIGTPEFMSPEQLLGDPIDPRSDLYALGCVLYLMLTGTPPFDATTREQLVKRRLAEAAPSVQQLDPTLPDSLATIVARLLARSPNDRYESASEASAALMTTHVRRADVTRPLLVNRYTPRSAPTVAFLNATQATTEITPVPAPAPQTRARFILAALVLVIIAGIVALYATQDNESAAFAPVDTVVTRRSAIVRDTMRRDTGIAASAAVSPIPMVDSAQMQMRAAQKRATDSLARFEREAGATHAPIERYRKAIVAGDINALRAALPPMTSQQEENWQRNFFSRSDHIDAVVHYGESRIHGDYADVDFSLAFSYVDKTTKQQMTPTIRQHAVLGRTTDGWKITVIR